MGYQQLMTLARSYPAGDRDYLLKRAHEYRVRDESTLLDLAATAADVSTDRIINLGLEPDADPDIAEAFRRQYPNDSLDSLQDRSADQIQGYISGIKGKYFEMLVARRLNAGERVGEIALQPGQKAILADSPTQKGFDIRIVNRNGETDEAIQAKATESMAYVKDHLERYPHFRVVAPEEIDGASEKIIQTDISHGQLKTHVTEQVNELGEGTTEDLLDKGAEAAVDVVPGVSALVVVATEGRAVLTGRASLQESLRRGRGRLARSAVYSALGVPLGPAVAGLRLAENRLTARASLGELLETKTEELRLLAV